MAAQRHMVLRLESPLMSFGGETIDAYGPTRDFPARSMLTGLLGNALGLRRTEGSRMQELENRLVFAARIDREGQTGAPAAELQTAAIGRDELGWTTKGRPEGRAGGQYRNTLLYREYLADAAVTVALRLAPDEGQEGNLDRLAEALRKPARPLYLGRKPCLPAGPVFQGFCFADTALQAVLNWPVERRAPNGGLRTIWPAGEGLAELGPEQTYLLADRRDWRTRLHGGSRLVHEAHIPAARFRSREDEYLTSDPDAPDGADLQQQQG